MIRFILNDTTIASDARPGMVLLDFIRYHQRLTGTKIGCREGDCGACTVLVGEIKDGVLRYESMTSCLLPLGNVQGKHVVTIEGINGKDLNPVQQAMAKEGATQCGFCTPGFVVSLTGYCLGENNHDKNSTIASIDGNICRCTGYKSIERAAEAIAQLMEAGKENNPLQNCINKNIVPAYFSKIKERLHQLLSNGLYEQPATDNEKRVTVGGGTDLYVQKHEEMPATPIRFVFDKSELNGIRIDGNKCYIGASATVSDLRNSADFNKLFPEFHKYSRLISSTPIRNMATLAGNFVNASPIGDLTIYFLALDARLVLAGPNGKRELPLRKFYKGYKQLNLATGEIIEEVWIEIPAQKNLFHFEKVSKRTHLDIASVNTAINIQVNADEIVQCSISAGGVGPIPMYLENTSGFLGGKTISIENIREAIAVMESEISPISDARGSKEYKTILLGQLIRAHFLTLFPQIKPGLLLQA